MLRFMLFSALDEGDIALLKTYVCEFLNRILKQKIG